VRCADEALYGPEACKGGNKRIAITSSSTTRRGELSDGLSARVNRVTSQVQVGWLPLTFVTHVPVHVPRIGDVHVPGVDSAEAGVLLPRDPNALPQPPSPAAVARARMQTVVGGGAVRE